MIAQGAEPILQARLQGMRPAEMVLISLVGPVKTGNHVVRALTGHDFAYDWRWAHKLDVCLIVDDNIEWAPTLKDIAKCRPDYLCVWNQYGKWGAKVFLVPSAEDIKRPSYQWEYEIDFIPWLDFQNADFENGETYRNAFSR